MSERRLRQMLRDCLVQIDNTDRAPAGSGFFVAPDYLLTCSHVLRRSAGDPVSGQWREAPWSGTVAYASSPPPDGEGDETTIWPEPDLAVIRLNDSFSHPCARLCSDEPEEGSQMVAVGRRLPFGNVPGDFSSATMEYTGTFLYLMRLRNEKFGPGMSGGPVLDLSSGGVCGVAKLAGPDQDGYAVPSRLAYSLPGDVAGEMLRSHDRYHDENREWARAQQVLWNERPRDTAAVLSPDSEAELLGLLARLPRPDPARLGQLFRECASALMLPDPGPLRELRDVALQLAGRLHDRDRPHPVIILAELLAASHPGLAIDLRDWSTAEATRQDRRDQLLAWRAHPGPAARQAGTQADPMSVVIQLEPCDHAPGRYVYTIWRNHADAALIERENEPLELAEIVARLKGKLPPELGKLPGEHVIVEFILPPELFDEPVHLWQLFRHSYVLLGYRYPVVIRDWERFNDVEDRNHAKMKWDRLSALSTTPLQWLDCVERRTPEQLYRWFEAKIERATLGMPGPATAYAEALSAALDAGVRVALWRRLPCEVHGNTGISTNKSPCDGMLFRRAARRKVSPEPVNLLPEKLKDLRLSPGILSESVMLWDNPHRGPHPRGLAVH
jgi:vWA-MoxR associated protein C-terminal domain/Trypsin-like peptidase domain/vWA-MoxR associated protein middle region 0